MRDACPVYAPRQHAACEPLRCACKPNRGASVLNVYRLRNPARRMRGAPEASQNTCTPHVPRTPGAFVSPPWACTGRAIRHLRGPARVQTACAPPTRRCQKRRTTPALCWYPEPKLLHSACTTDALSIAASRASRCIRSDAFSLSRRRPLVRRSAVSRVPRLCSGVHGARWRRSTAQPCAAVVGGACSALDCMRGVSDAIGLLQAPRLPAVCDLHTPCDRRESHWMPSRMACPEPFCMSRAPVFIRAAGFPPAGAV